MPGPATFSFPPSVFSRFGPLIERLCARAGVTPSNAWATSEFFRIWAAADQEFEDRSAGLRFGTEGITRGYGAASLVALHAPNLRHALAALSRYKSLTCPELVEIECGGDEAIVRYRWLQVTGAVPRLLVDTTMASLREMARRGSAGRVVPIRLELARQPVDHALLCSHFGCPVAFGTAHDAMVFNRAALDVPFVGADGGAFAHVLEGLEKRLADEKRSSGLVGDLRLAIARQLSEGRSPSIAAIARRLELSSRTLQRRLGTCETSFQQELASTRRIMASRLLAVTELDPVAIAMLLGFAEPNSFVRAFRAWERTTPLRWRQRQIAVHSQA